MTHSRLLVVIASYGNGNDPYLSRLVQEYQSMSMDTHVVVCTNVAKSVPEGVELIVGMPTEDPWSLPFAHKQIMAERIDQYDLFIYSEDDTLATESNISAFLRTSAMLPSNEIPGFVRYEVRPDGTLRYCDVNGHYHWDPSSVVRRGGEVFAFFTNEHAAFYILTREQLRQAIASGGFLVPPHHGKYDLACSAATDPYTQCGFKKLVCISSMQDFSLHHLPNKYLPTRFGTDEALFRKQIQALIELAQDDARHESLLQTETRLRDAWYSKDYYEPARAEVLTAIPPRVGSVLSVGCGSGATEKCLAQKGVRVTAVCLDPVIGACADGGGIETVWGEWETVRHQLKGRSYDCILLSNVLHLVTDPAGILNDLRAFLAPKGHLVILLPNLGRAKNLLGKLRGDQVFLPIGDYERSGAHDIRMAKLRSWLTSIGVSVTQHAYLLSESSGSVQQLAWRIASPLFGHELLVVAQSTLN